MADASAAAHADEVAQLRARLAELERRAGGTDRVR